jgi:hypothetical protein
MPIAAFEDWLAAFEKLLDQLIEWRDDLISLSHGQRSAGTEIVLHIDNDQRALLLVWH